jgi:hypothetical protein
LPEATAMMFFTSGIGCRPRCTEWATISVPKRTATCSTPGTVRTAAVSASRNAACRLAAG